MRMIDLLRRLRHDIRGFTSVTVMGAMLVGGLLVTAAFAASDGGIKIAKSDQNAKQAYAAAEAGANVYAYHLNQDNGYWLDCTNVPAPNATESSAVNQQWNGSGADPRTWRNVPGANSQYTIELLPTSGYTQCVQNDAKSMIDPNTGAFRIRVTGRAGGVKRSIVTSFRPAKFIDYIYFTDFETADPYTYSASQQAWASANCQKWYRNGRSSSCTAIQFATDDVVAGPFHTNDDILTCGTPTFGRTGKNDAIEVSAPSPGYRTNCGSIVPDFQGPWRPGSAVLTLPPSNSTLNATAGAKYNGTTKIELSGTNMKVTPAGSTTQTTVPVPSNGVVYVSNTSCGTGYTITQKYTNPSGCGDVWVHGTTSKSITIAADNDVIVDGDVLQASGSDALVGLIANNMVRVYHPVARDSSDNCTGANSAGTNSTLTIQAAILALAHSFIVDNYYCGSKLGNLNVTGAIAQKFRGPVGTSGGSGGGTGYTKNYVYDDRLSYREPPSFLDPVQLAWRISRQTEQIPPR